MPALIIEIPAGHVAHWKKTDNGYEIEYLRFLTRTSAKSRQNNTFESIKRRKA